MSPDPSIPALGRLLAVDYGRRRVGLALSDEIRCLSFPHGMLEVQTPTEAVRRVAAFAHEHDAVGIVVGMPLNMNGTRGEMAQEVAVFIIALERASTLPVTSWDERMSSQHAERVLIEADVSRRKRKGLVDAIAAQQLLASYLTAHETPTRLDPELEPDP